MDGSLTERGVHGGLAKRGGERALLVDREQNVALHADDARASALSFSASTIDGKWSRQTPSAKTSRLFVDLTIEYQDCYRNL